MLDDTQRALEVGEGDLPLGVRLNQVETASDLFVVLLELSVNLLDHRSDALRHGDDLLVRLVGTLLGFLFLSAL